MLAKSTFIFGTTAAVLAAGVFASAFNLTGQSELDWAAKENLPAPLGPPGACGLPANNWHLNGNRGSNPDVNYVGTGDSVDLVIRTDCIERMRVLATGEVLIHDDLFVGGDLSVDGATTLSDLKVENELSVQGNLSVDGHSALNTLGAFGNASFQQNLSVNGSTSLNTLAASGNAIFQQNASVSGHTSLNTLAASGNANFQQNASVSGHTSLNTLNASSQTTLGSNLTVAGNASFASDVNVSGTTRTGVLEILGADLAEEFPFSEPVQPGMVVEIDMNNAGHLRPASGAYNRRVAGIVAGANEFSTGVVLGRGSGNEFAAPVALTGRVYVYVDATERAVEVGDMLTTSERPGYAMAVRDFSRMHGAVIGKAMTAMPEGETGLVLVLVNLQ